MVAQINNQDQSFIMNEKVKAKKLDKKGNKIIMEEKKSRQNKFKNRKSSDTQIQLSDPFGFVSKRHFVLSDAQTPIKFLYHLNEYLIAIAAKHIYVFDSRPDSDRKLLSTINLACVTQFSFIVESKLHVGGATCVDIFSLSKWPFPNISTVKKQLVPIPKKILVLDNFYFFSGEALFSLSNFDALSVLDLNPVYKTTRVLKDFSSCNVRKLKNADHANKEFVIATNEGLCFVKIT